MNPPDQASRPISGTLEPAMTGCQRLGLRLRAAECVERCDGSELAPDRGARLIKGAGQAPDQVVGVVRWQWWRRAARTLGLRQRQAQRPAKELGINPATTAE